MKENINTDNNSIARRTVLASLGVSTAALAGCTSGTSTDPSNTSNSTDGNGIGAEGSDVFTSVEMGDANLEIEVADDASVEFINLIDPNGELFDQQRLASGETTISFEILGRYEDSVPTGEYELIALDGDEQVDTTTITLEAECTITDVLWAAENPDMEWDKNSPVWDKNAAVLIENKGNIPSLLTELQWTGAPINHLLSTETKSYYHETRLPPGETTTVYSGGRIYRTESPHSSVDCGELGTESLTVTAIVQVGDNPSYSQQIRYGGTERSCDLTILDNSSADSLSENGDL